MSESASEAAWELVARDPPNPHAESITQRLRVPGGWLYRQFEALHNLHSDSGSSVSVALAFVPFSSKRKKAAP